MDRKTSTARIVKAAQDSRSATGFQVEGRRITQWCPNCGKQVYAVLPRPPKRGDNIAAEVDRFSREVNKRLDQAVVGHVRGGCTPPRR